MNLFRKSSKTALVLALLMMLQQLSGFFIPAYALGSLDFSSSIISKLVNDSSKAIAPGVQERRVTFVNQEGKRIENFIVEVDLEGSPNTSVVAGSYKDGTEYGMTTVREQAEYAEVNGKKVVAAVNADFYNMATGVPLGCFVKDGKEIKSLPSDWKFFGIKKDGTAVLGDYNTYTSVRTELKEALGGNTIIVKNGQAVDYSSSGDTYFTTRQPRTAVGIKEDGTVVFMVSDGRQEPYSAGLTMYEIGQLMKDLGCVSALNLDGGGSSTYLSREQGTDNLECKNSPSDGTERPVANSFLVLSDTVSDGVFASAVIEPFDKTYTPNSVIEFTAKGMDASGASAELPEFSNVSTASAITGSAVVSAQTTSPSALRWALSDDSFGTIDSATGEFVSNGKQGQVQVRILLGDDIVGSTYLEIRDPDEIFFVQGEISLEFDSYSNLGFKATYNERDVILKEGDISWDIPDGMGTMGSDNIFHTSASGSVSGIITARYKDTDLTASIDAKVGQLPVVLYDFEDGVGEWKPGSAGRGEIVSIESVDYASGEPVRFGDQSLKINYDLTGAQTGTTLGIYAGPGESKDIPGAPKAMGAWVYATEEAQGYWLRMYVYDKNGQYKPINFTDIETGINWTGWKYVEAPIPDDYQGPFKTYPNQLIRMMSLKSGISGPMSKGEVYVDNVRVVYGASVDDMYHPIINDINVDGKTYSNNTVSISTSFADDMSDKYATGMNYDRIHVYVDGKNYTNAEGLYALNKGQNTVGLSGLELPDGIHRVDVVVQDNFGNETSKTAYFTVNTGAGTTVDLQSVDANAVLGKTYKLNIVTNDTSDINSVTTQLKISKDFPISSVDFGSNSEGSTYDYNAKKGTLDLNITNSGNSSVLASVNIDVPANTIEGETIKYNVESSDIEYNSDKGSKYASSFCIMPAEAEILSGYVLDIVNRLVGAEGLVIVRDIDGNPAEGVSVKVVVDGAETELGITDAEGIARGTAMTDTVKKFSIYAEKDGVISFSINTQSLNPLKDKIPSNILTNAVVNSATSKNITWMSNPLTSEDAAVMQIAVKSEYDTHGESAFSNVTGKYSDESFTGYSDVNSNGLVRLSSAVAENLMPETNYIFRIGDGLNWSETKEFSTPSERQEETNFFVLGDTQTANTTNLESIISAIENDSINYDFSLHVGDIVDEASKFNQLDAISSVISGYNDSFDVDMIKVLGNHEYMGDEDGHIAEKYYNTPLNGPEEALGSCYSVEYGNAYVAVISFTSDSDLLDAQLNWLKEDAKKSDKTWKILATHQPVYFSNPQGGNGLFKEVLPKVMEEIGMDFVFSGHDHAYARTAKLKGGEEDPRGTVYVIAGSTGEKYYEAFPDEHFEVFNDEQKPIYLTANATDEEMTINAVRPGGEIVDSFIVEKVADNTIETSIKDTSAQAGEDAEVKLELSNMKDVGGLKIKIGYDSQKLTYKSIEFSEDFQVNAVNTDVPGEINFAVLNAEGINKDYLEGASIIFTVDSNVENDTQIPVTVISAEAFDTNKEDIDTHTQDGSITVIRPIEAPSVSNVTFDGEAVAGLILKASYTYIDPQSLPESGTSFRWLISEDGENFTAIENEVSSELEVKEEYAGKLIKVEVTASNGTKAGAAMTGDNGRNRVILPGDVYGEDGAVNMKDALHILQYTVEKAVLNKQQIAAADITGDEKVNVQDVMVILQSDIE